MNRKDIFANSIAYILIRMRRLGNLDAQFWDLYVIFLLGIRDSFKPSIVFQPVLFFMHRSCQCALVDYTNSSGSDLMVENSRWEVSQGM